jgi:hypothetical protein
MLLPVVFAGVSAGVTAQQGPLTSSHHNTTRAGTEARHVRNVNRVSTDWAAGGTVGGVAYTRGEGCWGPVAVCCCCRRKTTTGANEHTRPWRRCNAPERLLSGPLPLHVPASRAIRPFLLSCCEPRRQNSGRCRRAATLMDDRVRWTNDNEIGARRMSGERNWRDFAAPGAGSPGEERQERVAHVGVVGVEARRPPLTPRSPRSTLPLFPLTGVAETNRNATMCCSVIHIDPRCRILLLQPQPAPLLLPRLLLLRSVLLLLPLRRRRLRVRARALVLLLPPRPPLLWW